MKNLCRSVVCAASGASGACHRLGPYLATSVAALGDLGLSDQEIADYFGIPPERITRLRLGIAPELRLVCTGNAARA